MGGGKTFSHGDGDGFLCLIDGRALERECLLRGIEVVQPGTRVEGFASSEAWAEKSEEMDACTAILYNTEGRQMANSKVSADITQLATSTSVPVIVLSQSEDLKDMILALDCGAKGYIPASLGIEATLLAVRLTGASAVFLPARSLMSMRELFSAQRSVPETGLNFTSRQYAVADALRRGKPNKLIAYELNMCESTVKVHIRNIMKKLQARNRTEAGYKLNAMLPGSNPSDWLRDSL